MAGEKKQRSGHNRLGPMGTAGMLSLSMMGLGTTALTPAMAVLGEHFAGRNVSFIMTLATLGCVGGSLLAGTIAGKRIGYKALVLISTAACAIVGVLPAFFDNYTALLVDRLFFGVALGLFAPVGNALAFKYMDGQIRNVMLGLGTTCMNIGGIVFQQLGGILGARSWQLTFYAHLFFVVSFVLCLFLPNGDRMTKEQREAAKAAQASMPKERMNIKNALLLGIILLVFQTVNMSVMMNASVMFVERGIGGTLAGATYASAMGLTLYTVAGMIAGVLFSLVYKALKRMMFCIDFILVALGAFFILIGYSIPLQYAGFMLIGLGFNWAFAVFLLWIGNVNPLSRVGASTSIVVAMMNFGGFLCSFWMMAMGTSNRIAIADMIGGIAFAIILIFINPFNKNNQKIISENMQNMGGPEGPEGPQEPGEPEAAQAAGAAEAEMTQEAEPPEGPTT